MRNLFLKPSCLIPIILIIFSALVACTTNETGVTNDVVINTDNVTEPVAEEEVVSRENRTEQIFDASKYSDKFSIWFFYLDAEDKSGDAMLLRTPDGKTMLLDSGIPDCAEQVLRYIKDLGIEKIDYAAISHMHSDHIGGFSLIIDSLPVEKVLLSNYTNENSGLAVNLLNKIREKNIDLEFVKEGDTFQFGGEIEVQVLNPQESDGVMHEGAVAGFLNDRSVVFKMSYKNNSFLFTGDIYMPTEERLMQEYASELDADLIKVPHHGGGTSSNTAFVNTVSPKVSIITYNNFGNLTVYEKYKKAGSMVYVTGLDGNILVTSDGDALEVFTEKDRKGALKP